MQDMVNSNSPYDMWYKNNKKLLNHLYYELINISKDHNIIICDNDITYNNYLKMMYNSSSKKYIDKSLYPEFFHKKNNNHKKYKKYKILDIN
jgi:hypothetical protein